MNSTVKPVAMNSVLPDSRFPSGIDLDSRPTLILAKSQSPLSEFLGDEEATSTCPLLTPSPPLAFSHPLAVDSPPVVAYERQISPSSTDLELSALPKLNGNATLGYGGMASSENNNNRANKDGQGVFECENSIPSVMESSSSSSSVLQEQTVCAQLLSSHLYQHLTKSSDIDSFTSQENGGKPPLSGMQLAVRKSRDDFCFLTWNWPLIRKLSFWSYISLLVGCVGIVVGLVATLPTVCNPPHSWWQGTLFYEVFPASFQDSNNDSIGDFGGLTHRAQYLRSLGVRAVRLNSIFPSNHPESYDRPINLTNIESSLGNQKDFDDVLATLHKYNISVILDLPIYPFVNQLAKEEDSMGEKHTVTDLSNNTDSSYQTLDLTENAVSHAIRYWLQKGVDGFYLKNLEKLVHEPHFIESIKEWRKIINSYSRLDEEKILICSADVLKVDPADPIKLNEILNKMDLIDVKLDAWINGTNELKKQVDSVLSGILYSKPGYPWIHWHLGREDTHRITTRLGTRNASLALILFQMMLPGTPSIFHGDEIGLQDSIDPNEELADGNHLNPLARMQWNASGFTQPYMLPWLSATHDAAIDKVSRVVRLRESTPPIYMNGVWKDHENLPNTEIRHVDGDVMVVERRYPRRNSYVLVSSLADRTVTRDLSVYYYGGEVVFDFQGRLGDYLTFHSLTLYPGEAIIIKLDK